MIFRALKKKQKKIDDFNGMVGTLGMVLSICSSHHPVQAHIFRMKTYRNFPLVHITEPQKYSGNQKFYQLNFLFINTSQSLYITSN